LANSPTKLDGSVGGGVHDEKACDGALTTRLPIAA